MRKRYSVWGAYAGRARVQQVCPPAAAGTIRTQDYVVHGYLPPNPSLGPSTVTAHGVHIPHIPKTLCPRIHAPSSWAPGSAARTPDYRVRSFEASAPHGRLLHNISAPRSSSTQEQEPPEIARQKEASTPDLDFAPAAPPFFTHANPHAHAACLLYSAPSATTTASGTFSLPASASSPTPSRPASTRSAHTRVSPNPHLSRTPLPALTLIVERNDSE
ncbi:hypothetical protein C8F04DRAFT_1394795 [Mycena alexandri]|uniref:Uncharacterized protein n=1 Tax=Mycena alexandri TaxID=1745969 RepID=A0AAD6SYW4_9AGAR|nr:hypothetical protein C8F04DRAFT_1394795 [Mycena alexandri]